MLNKTLAPKEQEYLDSQFQADEQLSEEQKTKIDEINEAGKQFAEQVMLAVDETDEKIRLVQNIKGAVKYAVDWVKYGSAKKFEKAARQPAETLHA